MRRGLALFLAGVRETASLHGDGAGSLAGIPARVARAWRDELLSGYRQDPADLLAPIAARAGAGLVAARGIPFSSICRHHLMPFQGVCHLAYWPDGRIAGLSRLGRLVDCLSRRLQLQEVLTRQIADAIQEHLRPQGAACVMEATHTCMTARGSRKAGSRIVTAAFTGAFLRRGAGRREVLSLLAAPAGAAGRAQSGRPVRVTT